MKRLFKGVSWLLIVSLMIVSVDFTHVFASAKVEERAASYNGLIIVDTGIHISNKYYSREEFVVLLEQAVPIKEVNLVQPRSVASVVAGTWFIPGIGTVVITAAGGIIIAGTVIATGSWLYNKVTTYFAKRAYEEAKEKGTKTDNHSSTTSNSLPKTGKAYSSKDQIKNGKVYQRRYYGKDGNAEMDIDYTNHGNSKLHPKVPHRHDWVNGQRSKSWY